MLKTGTRARSFIACIALCAVAPGSLAADDSDTGISTGNQLPVPAITDADTKSLYILGKVWGYLKYHHPRVTAGCFDWDEKLVAIAEEVAAADNLEVSRKRITEWVVALDDPAVECDNRESQPVHLPADNSWIADQDLLGDNLGEALRQVRQRAGNDTAQHYVSLAPGVGNPQFQNENAYPEMDLPGWQYRLLALFRYWNIIEYWFPYRDLISSDWDAVLEEFIPRLINSADEEAYLLELMALIASVEDGHANLWSAIDRRPPAGSLDVPVHVRFVEGRPIVWRETRSGDTDENDSGSADKLRFGDVILAVDGIPVEDLIESWSPYYGASNTAALHRQIMAFLLRGSSDRVDMRVERDGRELELSVGRIPRSDNRPPGQDRDGETLQLLSGEVAYLKLSSVSRTEVPDYLEQAIGRRGLIVDIRNYPADFMVFTLGQHLVNEPTPFARFTTADLESPGTFRWTEPIELTPEEPYFGGKLVILVDESSQSQSEYTTMAFRAVRKAIVVGSRTAGADGNVSAIPLPGGHRTAISGIGVFYPDNTPTQQVGIVPDIAVSPTISGIRAGRDEVLERAVLEIMDGQVDRDALLDMTRLPHAPGTVRVD